MFNDPSGLSHWRKTGRPEASCNSPRRLAVRPPSRGRGGGITLLAPLAGVKVSSLGYLAVCRTRRPVLSLTKRSSLEAALPYPGIVLFNDLPQCPELEKHSGVTIFTGRGYDHPHAQNSRVTSPPEGGSWLSRSPMFRPVLSLSKGEPTSGWSGSGTRSRTGQAGDSTGY
jgi:hypothetical protein